MHYKALKVEKERRQEKQTNVATTRNLQTISTSNEIKNKRSLTDDHLTQSADKVTKNFLFILINKVYVIKPRRPEKEEQYDKT